MNITWVHVYKIVVQVPGIQLMDRAVDREFSVSLPDEMLKRAREASPYLRRDNTG